MIYVNMTIKPENNISPSPYPLPPGESGLRSWQKALADVITDPQELGEILNLDPQIILSAIKSESGFALRVPRAFVARMSRANPDDPLLKQVLPQSAELLMGQSYRADALQERAKRPIPGLLHKYHGRVLVIVAGSCAIHCRYCFRRHFPYAENALSETDWDKILDYIAADPSLHEVIFSGGDPLLVKDKVLAEIAAKIACIPQVRTLRLHTRVPIVIPERINDELLAWLTSTRLHTVVVVHVNHPNELDAPLQHSLRRLRAAGVTVLNQSVLLKGVNDHADILIELSHKLFAAGVMPYYLNVLDKVQGAMHFAVPDSEAQKLLGQMMQYLPGYLVPKLVREQPGALSKLLLLPL